MTKETLEELAVNEIRDTPEEYLPSLIRIMRAYNEGVTLKPAAESFRQALLSRNDCTGGLQRMNELFVVDVEGKKKSVILPIEEYERMLEDLHDLAVVAERRNEENVSLEEMEKRLREDGLL
jgi:hypothetical protein